MPTHPPTRTVILGAVTAALDWSMRQTCSGPRYDPVRARAYIDRHTEAGLQRMALAARQGAELVLGPEYFTGSEMFTTSLRERAERIEGPDGPTARRMAALAREMGVSLTAAYEMRLPDGRMAETGLVVGPDGQQAGLHVKGSGPGEQQVFDLPVARAAMLVCADAEKPANILDLSGRGVQVLLIPGCGFMGRFHREYVLVRALELKAAVIYADESRAMIVSPGGEVVAETRQCDTAIVAAVELPARPPQ